MKSYRIKNYFSKRLLGMSLEDIAELKADVVHAKARIEELKAEAEFWRTRSQCHQHSLKAAHETIEELKSQKDSVFSVRGFFRSTDG